MLINISVVRYLYYMFSRCSLTIYFQRTITARTRQPTEFSTNLAVGLLAVRVHAIRYIQWLSSTRLPHINYFFAYPHLKFIKALICNRCEKIISATHLPLSQDVLPNTASQRMSVAISGSSHSLIKLNSNH